MHPRAAIFCSIRCYCLVFMACFLAACSASQYAPVQELGYSSGQRAVESNVKTTPASYQVRSGDTMFSIAWRFGWDYKKLAKANGINSPFTIYVGQVVYLNGKNDINNSVTSLSKVSTIKPAVGTKKSITNTQPKASASSQKNAANKDYKGPYEVIWNWPIQGKVVRKFSNKAGAFNGIDLSSSLENTVKAASSGIIVYAGSGIQGYGNLVVVKHNGTFLSAYAYNSRILVAEGAAVKAGQAIAEVGKGPQLDPRLHFEIRKNGKPVNPLLYLPKQ